MLLRGCCLHQASEAGESRTTPAQKATRRVPSPSAPRLLLAASPAPHGTSPRWQRPLSASAGTESCTLKLALLPQLRVGAVRAGDGDRVSGDDEEHAFGDAHVAHALILPLTVIRTEYARKSGTRTILTASPHHAQAETWEDGRSPLTANDAIMCS